VGAELFRADRRTDMAKLTVALRHFANSAKSDMLNNYFFTSLMRVPKVQHTTYFKKKLLYVERLNNPLDNFILLYQETSDRV